VKKGVIGIIYRNKRKEVLLVKRRDVPIWVLPGGGVEKGESLSEAVIREVQEETGYLVRVLKYLGEYRYRRTNHTNHLFLCQIVSGSPTPNSEAKAIQFFPLNNLPQPRFPYLDLWLKDSRKYKHPFKKELAPIKTTTVAKYFFKYPVPVIRYLLKKIGLTINL